MSEEIEDIDESEKIPNSDFQEDYLDGEDSQIDDRLVELELTKNYPAIFVDSSKVEGLSYDITEYKKGLKESSQLAGFINGLKGAGLLDSDLILQLILNQQTINHNIEVNKLEIEKIKAQSYQQEKNQL